MLKIKQKSKIFWQILIVMIGVNLIYLARNIITNMPVLQPFKGSIIFLLVFGVLLYLLEKGNWIEVNNGVLNVSLEYLKNKYLLKNVSRIYCSQHVFLGPTIFLEYKKEELTISQEKKLLVLNQYRNEDKKALLDFLAEKYPEIQQDENCHKIRNGEKVLTTLKDK